MTSSPEGVLNVSRRTYWPTRASAASRAGFVKVVDLKAMSISLKACGAAGLAQTRLVRRRDSSEGLSAWLRTASRARRWDGSIQKREKAEADEDLVWHDDDMEVGAVGNEVDAMIKAVSGTGMHR